jgi:serine/threonine protein kinase
MQSSRSYVPDRRLAAAYEEACQLDERGVEALCPSYLEVAASGPRYEIREPLGRGATKEVYRAWDSRMKRHVALAYVRPDCGPETYDAFIHEAWLSSSLSHPNIIGIHDLGVDDDGRPFFTMTLKGGRTLARLIEDDPPVLTELLGILIKISDAVAYAHSRRTLHLDLKPENIQVDHFGDVLVCDWGLGSVLRDGTGSQPPSGGGWVLPDEHDSHSLTGQIRGTPGYMAPEQADPDGAVDERTDVFALGCLLHAMLTGESPVGEGTREEQLRQTREARFSSPQAAFPERNVPAALEAVFRRATRPDPSERYATVEAFRDEIGRRLAGYATGAESAGFFREAALFIRRNRASVSASLLGVVGLSVLSVLFLQRLERQRELTAAEREKSSALVGDVTRLEELYATQSEEFRESARELARDFAESANTLKNVGIFNDPVETLEKASKLAEMALSLDPDCEEARFEQFDLRCHMLDFRSALGGPRLDEDNRFFDYYQFVRLAPDMNFSAHRRPESEELAGFLHRAAEVNSDRGPLMERIVSYDSAVRRGRDGYEAVVSALLGYVNPGWDRGDFRYDPEADHLDLSADGALRLVVPPGGGSGQSLLRFIPVRTLKLEVGGRFDLHHLDLCCGSCGCPANTRATRSCGWRSTRPRSSGLSGTEGFFGKSCIEVSQSREGPTIDP